MIKSVGGLNIKFISPSAYLFHILIFPVVLKNPLTLTEYQVESCHSD